MRARRRPRRSLSPASVPGSFDRYGIRVPFVAISPFAKPHYVSHNVYDHTSILRFIETRFDLPALTAATPTPIRRWRSSTSRTPPS